MTRRAVRHRPVATGTGRHRRAWPLRQVYCYLTAGCNLRCRHCWLAPVHEPDPAALQQPVLDLTLCNDVIRQAIPLGCTTVKLTGGEPLMHPHIGRILATLRREQLALTLETNGTLLDAPLARAIARCRTPHVAISIDASDARTHDRVRGVPGSFARARAGLRHLVAAGIRPQLICSVLRCTRSHLARIVRWAERHGVGSVKFNVIQPAERGRALHTAGAVPGIRALVATGAWMEQHLIPQSRIPVFFHHPAAFRPLGRMFNDGGNCSTCGIHSIIGVLSSGHYALCGVGATVPDLIFGDARTQSLRTVWRQHPVLNRLRRDLPAKLEGICARCVMRVVCLGSCVAQNYYTTRSLFAPFWYCDAAAAAGLFPASRLLPAAKPR